MLVEYFDSIITGLYLRKDNRLMCIIKKNNGQKTSASFPKVIIELFMNEKISKDKTIDHIDMDPLNNNLNNLQIIDREAHCKQDSLKNKDVYVNCFMCGNLFKINGKDLSCRQRKRNKSNHYFCSKRCVGKYGADVQNGVIYTKETEKLQRIKERGKENKQREVSNLELIKFAAVLDKFKSRLFDIIPEHAVNYLFSDKL